MKCMESYGNKLADMDSYSMKQVGSYGKKSADEDESKSDHTGSCLDYCLADSDYKNVLQCVQYCQCTMLRCLGDLLAQQDLSCSLYCKPKVGIAHGMPYGHDY